MGRRGRRIFRRRRGRCGRVPRWGSGVGRRGRLLRGPFSWWGRHRRGGWRWRCCRGGGVWWGGGLGGGRGGRRRWRCRWGRFRFWPKFWVLLFSWGLLVLRREGQE